MSPFSKGWKYLCSLHPKLKYSSTSYTWQENNNTLTLTFTEYVHLLFNMFSNFLTNNFFHFFISLKQFCDFSIVEHPNNLFCCGRDIVISDVCQLGALEHVVGECVGVRLSTQPTRPIPSNICNRVAVSYTRCLFSWLDISHMWSW